jgi:hypothetical protein
MNLRHIRPRSVDWYDATLEEGARGLEPLSAEERSRLKQVSEAEQQVSLRAIDGASLGQPGAIKFL